MRTIEHSPRYRKNLDSLISDVLKFLLTDKFLPERNVDHTLSGNWHRYRECHIKPDLLLIYNKPDQSTLRLARLRSLANCLIRNMLALF